MAGSTVEASSDSWKPRLTGASMTTSPHAKIAFVYSDNPFSKAVVVAAREQAKESGFAIVLDESYAPATTDFSPIINKIVTSSADALLGGGYFTDGATLARQIYDQKANLKYLSLLVAPDSPEFASLGPAAFGCAPERTTAQRAGTRPGTRAETARRRLVVADLMKAGLSIRNIATGTGIPVTSVHRAMRAIARAQAKQEVAVLGIMEGLLNKGRQRKAKARP